MPERLCIEEYMHRPVQYDPETGICHALKLSRNATVVVQFTPGFRGETLTITTTCKGLSNSGLKQYMSEVRRNKDVSWTGKSMVMSKKAEDYEQGCYVGNGDIESLITIFQKECRAAQSLTGLETAFKTERENNTLNLVDDSCCPIYLARMGQPDFYIQATCLVLL